MASQQMGREQKERKEENFLVDILTALKSSISMMATTGKNISQHVEICEEWLSCNSQHVRMSEWKRYAFNSKKKLNNCVCANVPVCETEASNSSRAKVQVASACYPCRR